MSEWRVVDEWCDAFPKEVVFSKRLSREQLAVMSRLEVLAYFGVRPRNLEETVSIPRPPPLPVRHLFASLLSCRPACGRRLIFEREDCTFVAAHATCSGCRDAVSEAA